MVITGIYVVYTFVRLPTKRLVSGTGRFPERCHVRALAGELTGSDREQGLLVLLKNDGLRNGNPEPNKRFLVKRSVKIGLNSTPGIVYPNPKTGFAMTEEKRKSQLLELFSTMSGKTKIVEPMKNIHGTLRDSDAIEREVALVMREIIEQGIFKTSLKPIQLAKLVTSFYAGKNDTEIARELGDEKLSKTVARARVRLKLFRELDFKMPFDKMKMEELLESGKTMKEVSDELGVSPSTLREYRHVIEEQEDPTIDPYIARIRDVMEDRDLSEQMTRSAQVDNLGESIDITEAELIDVT